MIKQTKQKLTALTLSAVLLTGLLAGCTGKDPKSTTSDQNNSKGASEEATKNTPGEYRDTLDAFAAKMEEQMKQDGFPGASLSVTENGKTIYSKGFGHANPDKEIPVDDSTLFYTGSVGKVYTTAAMLKLIQDQGLSLDDPVVNHLSEFQMADERYKDITLRMLLNHSAGLPSDLDALGMTAGGTVPKEANLSTLEELRSQTLRSTPGEYAVYSNTGFGIAQEIIEKMSGQTFGEYLKEHFFDPLKLENTYMAHDENEDVADERFALPVNETGSALPREYTTSTMAGAGSILSTTEDTCKFMNGILSPDSGILNEESIAELKKDQSLTANFPEQQELNGLGWDEISRTITETPVYEKSGASTHCSTKVITAPEAGITITASLTQFHNLFVYDELKNLMRDLLLDKGTITEQTDMPAYPEEASAKGENSTHSGIYTGGESLHDLGSLYQADVTENTMKHSIWNGLGWQELGEYTLRDDGSYGLYDEGTKTYTSYSFQSVGDDVYLVKRLLTPEYDRTTAVAKRIPEKTAVASWESYHNNLWLRTNIWPRDYQAQSCFSFLQTLEDLPGYVAVNGGVMMDIKDDNTLSSISNLPGGSGYPGLTFDGDRFSWIGMNFMNASEAAVLPAEDSTISLTEANTVQWYLVPADMEIDIDVPYDKVRVLNLSPEMTLSYDNLNKSEVFTAKAGSYIGLTGAEPTEIDMGISPVE